MNSRLATLLSLIVAVSSAAQTWTSGEYRYDGAGNIVSIGTAGAPNHRAYGYDAVSRLTKAHVGASHEYEYDAYGNRVAYSVDQQRVAVPVISAANRLADATYDAVGNQLSRGVTAATFDGFGMVTSYRFDAVNAETFVYTASDERIGVLRGTEWTWSLRDAGGRVLRQYRSSSTPPGTPWTWVEDFAYRGSLLLGSEREPGQGGRRHYHLDHLGSPRLVTSGAGSVVSEHDFLPFGEERTPVGQQLAKGFDREQPHRFTGHERDFDRAVPNASSAHIDSMHARYYAAQTGRFLSVDPGKDWVPRQPQSWNSYVYVRNNPVNNTDPTGRCAVASGSFVPCVRVMQRALGAAWDGLVDAAESSAIGEVYLAAESGDVRRQQIAQLRLTHEVMTGMIVTGMAPSELSAPSPGSFMDDARFAQRTYRNSFSAGGEFGGRTVDDVASELKSGTIGVKDVRVDYIVRDGNILILNTRSAKALEQAGIPRSQWNVVNRTGQRAYEARLTAQLRRNKLTSAGTEDVRRAEQ